MWKRIGLVAATGTALITMTAGVAGATSGSTTLNLSGGDKLQANAWHCGTYVRACSWANSAKVLGTHPSYADSVTNQSNIQVHGISLSISLGSTTNVSIIYHSSGLIKSKWTNYNAWISDSSGIAHVSVLSTYVSSREIASAHDAIFGSPSGVTAYAGAA
jgi:hypothetical protein